MPYRHEICLAGKTKQHTYYYAPRADTKEGSRRKKENRTPEAQKKVNRRQAEKKLTWILNENFDGTSLYITWSYDKSRRPDNKEALREDIDRLLNKIRKIYKKEGDTAKYVWVAEVGERGAVHIHMVLNHLDTAKLKTCWDKGYITVKPLDDSGQYRKLASYFIKYNDKTEKTYGKISGRHYNSSKNLKIPIPEKTTVRSRNAYSHTIEIPRGWYIDKESIAEAWHEVTGYMYFTYTLIHDGISYKQAKDTYTLNLETGEIQITEKATVQKNKSSRKYDQQDAPGAEGDKDTAQDAEAVQNAPQEAEPEKLVYVGPQLPRGRLKTNKIFEGTREQILASPEMAEVLKRYPLVKNMLVPVSKLAEAKQKIAAGGNALHKFYADIASLAATEGLEG